MATSVTKVTEPAVPEVADDKVTEPRPFDPRKSVYVYDTDTGKKLDRPVPETFLDGRFPQLKEVPSKKAGK